MDETAPKFKIKEVVIDNGIFNVKVDLEGIREMLGDKGLSQGEVQAATEMLVKFSQDVATEKESGSHLGSSMPVDAVLSTSGLYSFMQDKGVEIDTADLEAYISHNQ